MKKKKTALMMAAVMTVSLLAACGPVSYTHLFQYFEG